MDLELEYEITRTAEFIVRKNFKRIALQFPDELLKASTKVVGALRSRICELKGSNIKESEKGQETRLFVMADTTYGSCCVDEVGALHIDADCVIHYGHTCLSPTSVIPAFFVFGKAPIKESRCVERLLNYAMESDKPILVLYGLDYAHAIPQIREMLPSGSKPQGDIHFAKTMSSFMTPVQDLNNPFGTSCISYDCAAEVNSSFASYQTFRLGGLTWDLTEGQPMEDFLLFWIGSDSPAFANVVLTFNGCDIVRYDPTEDHLATDFSQQKKILKRRYYLVEKAKDANIVGILVGTLGVAGYLHMIHKMQELIIAAGRKAYTLVMGRPNPAKLANFPECDVFIYVACAQTALLDSKEFMAPVITPFEAMIAFSSGSQWTGSYIMQFQDLFNYSIVKAPDQTEEPRFSFFEGGYRGDSQDHDDIEKSCGKEELALVHAAEKALQVRSRDPSSLAKGMAKSGPEYFVWRSYQGLEINGGGTAAEPFVVGRSGKASGYEEERNKSER